jgi:hypothetical protein
MNHDQAMKDWRELHGWFGRALLVGVPLLVLLWLVMYYLAQNLPKANSSDIASVTQTLSAYTIEAAVAVPIAALVTIVGVLVTQTQVDRSELSYTQRLRQDRLLSVMMATGMVAVTSILAAVGGIVLLSVNLFAGQPLSVGSAVIVDGAILSTILVEAVLLYTLVTELIWSRRGVAADDSSLDD